MNTQILAIANLFRLLNTQEVMIDALIKQNVGEERIEIVKTVSKLCTKYRFTNVDCMRFTGMLFVESRYTLHAMNKRTGDYCMAQINHTHKLDHLRSLVDLEYCLNKGIEILDYFRKQFKKHNQNWFVHYNCGSRESCGKTPASQKYIKKVLAASTLK